MNKINTSKEAKPFKLKPVPQPTEHQEQCRVVNFCHWSKVPIFAIPNGVMLGTGANKFAVMAKLKAEGLSNGVPDLMIPVSSAGYHGLFIEMKRTNGSTVSEEQHNWLMTLQKNGYFTKVAYGADEAIKTIKEYVPWL